jgi:hypothetical protein
VSPVAVTLKEAFDPSATLAAIGWAEMVGASAGTTAGALPPPPQALNTSKAANMRKRIGAELLPMAIS